MILLNSVLVATDFGKASEAALEYGRNLARAFGGRLHVLHVAEIMTPSAPADFYTGPDWQEKFDQSARNQLDALLTRDDRMLHVKTALRTAAAPADAIVQYAKDAHIDLIVVGSHNRCAISHLFIGSVAERVVRTAPCPVLVVRSDEHHFITRELVAATARV